MAATTHHPKDKILVKIKITMLFYKLYRELHTPALKLSCNKIGLGNKIDSLLMVVLTGGGMSFIRSIENIYSLKIILTRVL